MPGPTRLLQRAARRDRPVAPAPRADAQRPHRSPARRRGRDTLVHGDLRLVSCRGVAPTIRRCARGLGVRRTRGGPGGPERVSRRARRLALLVPSVPGVPAERLVGGRAAPEFGPRDRRLPSRVLRRADRGAAGRRRATQPSSSPRPPGASDLQAAAPARPAHRPCSACRWPGTSSTASRGPRDARPAPRPCRLTLRPPGGGGRRNRRDRLEPGYLVMASASACRPR
jgi:hypothetical protein